MKNDETRFYTVIDEILATCRIKRRNISIYTIHQDDFVLEMSVINDRIFIKRWTEMFFNPAGEDYFEKKSGKYVACKTPEIELYNFLVEEGFPRKHITKLRQTHVEGKPWIADLEERC